MITERTLRKWRKEALFVIARRNLTEEDTTQAIYYLDKKHREVSERILRLTQELLDQHLLRK